MEGQLNRFGEILIVTAKLLSTMECQWASHEYGVYREQVGFISSLCRRSYGALIIVPIAVQECPALTPPPLTAVCPASTR